jgi:uncharacterized damage-inducible protein DinB
LEDGRRDVVETLRAVAADQAGAKSSAERWSPLECIEHVVTVEHRFIGWITNGSVIEALEDREKETRLGTMVRNRSTKAQAPEAVLPTGKYQSMEEAAAAFNEARDITVRIVTARGGELYAVGVKHPRFGEMNAAELVHLIAGHASRHAEQIREEVAALQGSR